ncbi:hypothetical protein [Brotaphodocola sp.]|uniref:hypothetical protein n=1 Tax=Brotaphodocola sp. TaxID=3073577 RepID=UPI003D7D7AF0
MKKEYRGELEKRMYPVMQKFRERARASFVLLQPELRAEMEEAARASDRYAQMGLASEQRKCIDEMVEKITLAYESELTWTYMAGVMDCLQFLEKTDCGNFQ